MSRLGDGGNQKHSEPVGSRAKQLATTSGGRDAMPQRESRYGLYMFQEPSRRPVGRLCYWGPEIIDGRLYHGFSTPSDSKPRGTHEYKVDAVTLDAYCRCSWCVGKRLSKKGREKYGELDLVRPIALCWHLNAIARWVKAHKKTIKDTRTTALEVNRLLAEQAREGDRAA